MTAPGLSCAARRAREFGLIAIAWSAFAAAAQPAPGDLAGLTAATPDGDWSMRIWRHLFGPDIVANPFDLGAPTTLMGNLFLVFNSALFAVGLSWAIYGVIVGVVQTAHEGEVLGRRMSTVWYPVRTIMGIAGLVPIFRGFTFYQALMMLLAVLGIGLGNALWTAAIDRAGDMQALVQQEGFTPSANAQVREAVKGVFRSGVCLAAEVADGARQEPKLHPSHDVVATAFADQDKGQSGYRFGSRADPARCGSIWVQVSGRGAANAFAFRNAAVDYGAIEAAATDAYIKALGVLVDQTLQVAGAWHAAEYAAHDNPDTAVPPVDLKALNAIVDQFITDSQAEIDAHPVDRKAVHDEVAAKMKASGWVSAGAWYSTFAEVDAALADATKGPKVGTTEPKPAGERFGSETYAALQAADAGLARAQDLQADASGDATRATLDNATRDFCRGGVMKADTGNCSLGQSLVIAGIRGTAIGAGGGGDGDGFAADGVGLVNPLIMSKNMGDYIMTVASTGLVYGFVAQTAAAVASKVPGGGALLGIVEKTTGISIEKTLAALKYVLMVLLALGAFMSIYIPLIPFITWMGAVLAYAASVLEGLAGASLHALAHLDGDGDGLGQRTAHGYIFMLNVLARPALMIIGFFAASAVMVVIGTLQAYLFLPAMANVQGNSFTGLFSIAGFLIVFIVLNITLISACFNLIYVITDQVLGFIGGNIQQSMTRDTGERVNRSFTAASQAGPQLLQSFVTARAQQKTQKPSNPGPGSAEATGRYY